MYQSRNQTVSS